MGIGNLNTLCKVLPPSNIVEAMPLNAVAVSYTHLDVYKRQVIGTLVSIIVIICRRATVIVVVVIICRIISWLVVIVIVVLVTALIVVIVVVVTIVRSLPVVFILGVAATVVSIYFVVPSSVLEEVLLLFHLR